MIFDCIIQRLIGLQRTFLDYFPLDTDDVSWVKNPFSFTETRDDMTVQDYEIFPDIIYQISR
jgi:hypothetical protein